MSAFGRFFSAKMLIRALCAQRIKEANRRYEKSFLGNVFSNLPDHGTTQAQPTILPGRREWSGYRASRNARARRTGRTVNEKALFQSTLALRKKCPQKEWSKNLEAKINHLQTRVFGDGDLTFDAPRITPVYKGENEYRPIAAFGTDDKIIEALAARYLRQQFDPVFHDSSLAFREPRQSKRSKHAINQIIDYQARYPNETLYIAECDIMGCYDCVDHRLVLEMLVTLSEAGGIEIDPRAIRILSAYLSAYSFPQNVLTAQKELKDRKGPSACFAWQAEELRKFHSNPCNAAIGIPQGGALSGLIVNLLLHHADNAVENFRLAGNDLLYLRYCDDIIIVSPSRDVAAQAFGSYLDQMRFLKLPVHPPVEISSYHHRAARRAYWTTKSKAPFAWGTNIERGQVPWIGFLGYQLRRNGMLRIRPSSLNKHKKKITAIAGSIIRHLDFAIKSGSSSSIQVSARSLYSRVCGKMIAMGVGRIEIGKPAFMTASFAGGFRLLKGSEFPRKMLRDLDRHRERNLRRIKRRLERLPPIKVKKATCVRRIPRFFGRPFSYLGQFIQWK